MPSERTRVVTSRVPTSRPTAGTEWRWMWWAVVVVVVLSGSLPLPRHAPAGGHAVCIAEPDVAGLATVTPPTTVINGVFVCCTGGAFETCTGTVQTVSLPDTLLTISPFAFAGLRALTSITIPDSVTSLGTDTFHACTSLVTLVLGSGMTGVPASLCEGCSSLAFVTLPPRVTHIGSSAFQGCRNLQNISLPNTVIELGASVFELSGLVDIVLPQGIESIPNNFCDRCANLRTVRFEGAVTFIGTRAFFRNAVLNNVVLPTSVRTYSNQAFARCTSLRTIDILATTPLPNTVVFENSGCVTALYTPATRICNCTVCPVTSSPRTSPPTAAPSRSPSTQAPSTATPTEAPTSLAPTTSAPTAVPTRSPDAPTPRSPDSPTTRSPDAPTTRSPDAPTELPSTAPTAAPTVPPSTTPSRSPTPAPTTGVPSQSPSRPLTRFPTSSAPTDTPTLGPTFASPSTAPSLAGAGSGAGSSGGGGGGGSLAIVAVVVVLLLLGCCVAAVHITRRQRQASAKPTSGQVVNQVGTMNPVFHTTLREPDRGLGAGAAANPPRGSDQGRLTVPQPNGVNYSVPFDGGNPEYKVFRDSAGNGLEATPAGATRTAAASRAVTLDDAQYVAPGSATTVRRQATGPGDVVGNLYATPDPRQGGQRSRKGEAEYGVPVPRETQGNGPAQGRGLVRPTLDDDRYVANVAGDVTYGTAVFEVATSEL
eukprot:m.9798 g.9798  ORF g.9798 m.9798 type:complete len:708 (+) comp4230_c0_seq1:287-2410(+)